jgi:hypothetical protein
MGASTVSFLAPSLFSVTERKLGAIPKQTMAHRTKGILSVSIKNIPELLTQAWLVYNSMSAKPTVYPAPNPALTVLLTAIQALEDAQKATIATKSVALTKARDAKAEALTLQLETELAYVQGLADASPSEAESLITGAGFALPKVPVHTKPLLVLKLGAAPGTIVAYVNVTKLVGRGVRKKVTINWQVSVDGGKTWANAPSTPLAEAELLGLPLMTTVYVRVSATVAKVAGAWSEPVNILVH